MSTVTFHTGGRASALPGGPIADRGVGLWLLAVAALIFAMVLLGGITRLTESGLSMVDWRPVTGVLPPLSEEGWQAAFEDYKQYPQYRVENRGMALAQFKTIYWWEYAHRMLGRLIGLIYILPLIAFWAKGRLPPRYGGRLAGIFLLGAAQGALGWFMVRSGLVDVPEVSHYRLTAHLGLAVLLFALVVWTALDCLAERRGSREVKLRRRGKLLTALVGLQILLGGMVAGLDAGLAYNTWPGMNGRLLPAEAFDLQPLWRNFLDNPALVQFLHRMGGYLVAAGALWLLWTTRRRAASAPARAGAGLLLVLVGLQIAVGVSTVLHHVPIALGALHQGLALLVFTGSLIFTHMHRKDPAR